ncbi:MAG: Tol-Pal system beta propeller repeat protein TolB [Cardiobacteriaceae bacterium]|nr:Tol-Pal system beta propeller repeat protein TolB [Cardiobacteriaceae bacterium]
MLRRAIKALWIGLVAMSFGLTTWAQVEVNVSGAKVGTKRIAVVPFVADGSGQVDFVISSDLHKTGQFQPIDPKTYPMRPTGPQELNFSQWQGLGADYVVIGRALNGQSSMVQFVLADVATGQILANEQVQQIDMRRAAHESADRILERLTGKRGAFATPIAYVLERGSGGNRSYALVVSDSDGANRKELVQSASPILSPAWSPNGRAIAFATYNGNQSQIVIQHLAGGSKVVVQSRNTASAPSFSPDGRRLVYMQSVDGNADIFSIDLASGNSQRLTNHAAIDTEPTFSPDGRYIYFTSDRSGSPQIYRMNASGGGEQRIPISGSYSANASLSPDGQFLALTRQSGGGAQIGLYDLRHGRFEALTNGRLDEGASFAANGDMLIYATHEGGRSILKIINSKGGVAQTLSDPQGRLRNPAWAPEVRK